MNTLKRIEQLEKELAELKEQVVSKPEPMFEIPITESNYYTLCTDIQSGRFQLEIDCGFDSGIQDSSPAIFVDDEECGKVADYLTKNFWFIRKAVEFADGYEFNKSLNNYQVYFDVENKIWNYLSMRTIQASAIFMSQENATKFIEWLNEHKPNGWD